MASRTHADHLLRSVCSLVVDYDISAVQIPALRNADYCRNLRNIHNCLSDRRFSCGKNNEIQTFFLGAADRNLIFCSSLPHVQPARSGCHSRIFSNPDDSRYLCSQRNVRRHDQLKKRYRSICGVIPLSSIDNYFIISCCQVLQALLLRLQEFP